MKNKDLEAFTSLVLEEADRKGCVFIPDLNCESGDMIFPDTYGWLIPNEKVEEFNIERESGIIDSNWSKYYYLVKYVSKDVSTNSSDGISPMDHFVVEFEQKQTLF